MKEPRCRGHCCRGFPLPVDQTYEMLRAEPRRFVNGEFIADMLVPIGINGPDGRPLFNCRHNDVVTGDCKVYANRPQMCRDFPYGNEYPVIVCALKEVCK